MQVLSLAKSHSKQRSNASFPNGKENYFLGVDKVKGVKRKTTVQEAGRETVMSHVNAIPVDLSSLAITKLCNFDHI